AAVRFPVDGWAGTPRLCDPGRKGGPMLLFGDQTPMPTPTMTVDPESVTPGFAGFAFIVVIVAAVVLLIWDMNRRIRRVRYREEIRAELDAEEAARDAAGAASGTAGTASDASGSPDDEDGSAPGGTDRA